MEIKARNCEIAIQPQYKVFILQITLYGIISRERLGRQEYCTQNMLARTRTPILFRISHMIWGPHCWWMESKLFAKIEPWELGGKLEKSGVGSRRLLPAKYAKGKQKERLEINFNES